MADASTDDKILVFIPAYNCAPQIGRVLAQFASVPPGVFSDIVVIDNGSRDDTVARAQAAAALVTCCPVRVVRNDENYNLGGSHKAAFADATARGCTHVAVLHGDDQGAVADLLPILQRGEHRRHAACLGARFMHGSRLAGYSKFRIFGNHVFNALFSIVSGRRVRDLGSGLNIFGPDVFRHPGVLRHADDLRFNVYLLLDCIDRRLPLLFFPISWREDDQVSNVKMFSQARRTLAIAVEYVFSRARFRRADHRDTLRATYRFKTALPLHTDRPTAAAHERDRVTG